jgi:hypothetical protein
LAVGKQEWPQPRGRQAEAAIPSRRSRPALNLNALVWLAVPLTGLLPVSLPHTAADLRSAPFATRDTSPSAAPDTPALLVAADRSWMTLSSRTDPVGSGRRGDKASLKKALKPRRRPVRGGRAGRIGNCPTNA